MEYYLENDRFNFIVRLQLVHAESLLQPPPEHHLRHHLAPGARVHQNHWSTAVVVIVVDHAV